MKTAKTTASISGIILRLTIVAGAAGLVFSSIKSVIGQSNSLSTIVSTSVASTGPMKFAPHLTPIDYAARTAGQCDIQNTCQSLDVAIRGEGYLQVKLPPEIENGCGFTRVGMLFTNKYGVLCVAIGDGLEIWPPITIPMNGENVEITEDGTVKYQPANDNKPQVAGRIHLARFAHPQLLKPMGRGVFCPTESSGSAVDGVAQAFGTTIQQGYLELLPELASIPRLGPPALQGSLQETGMTFDVAVQGTGWFHVRSISKDSQHSETEAYTRNGSMAVNSQGQLTIAERIVVPPIILPLSAAHISIAQEGTVQYKAMGSDQLTTAGQIRLTTFMNPRGLKDLGKGIYAETEDSGYGYIGNPGDNGFGQLIQGYLENRPEQCVLKLSATQGTDCVVGASTLATVGGG
jgi:flagellar basal body rod protein FlgG